MGTIPILYLCRSFLSLLYILSCSAFSFASTWNAITPSDPCNGCSTKLNRSVPSSTTGGSSTVTVTQAGGSSSTTSATSSSFTSTDSTSGSTTAPASSSAVVITIGTSVITSMELSSTSTSISTALQAAQKSKTATIVGAVLGSLLGLLLIGVMIFLLLRRRRRSLPPSATAGLEAFRYDPNLDTEAALGIYPREKATRSPPPSETSSNEPAFGPTSESEAFTETNNGTNNVSIAQPSASTEPLSATSAPIQQMEQRIQLLERMLRQADDEAGILLHDTSPPPYLAG
ncbi:hypothetical protein BT96DRAFT_918585 [Gymnopus androsaceus JB14]|uniref:Mid2 domain-containing protein n=1 Tax=Gymnopus androsaceus JB14 TaxID=1447944 RepID=A0A6A4HV94_9AGAR|nr:hypothetical protein BT96DRAFT_918585 [Gymnopus androsaceus JB14]